MKNFSRELFWSILKITIFSEKIDEKIINNCFLDTEKFEEKYSRFIKNNFLDNLNKNKSSQATWELLSILKLTNKISELSDWYFDITILPFLENIWYWKNPEKMEEKYWYKNIEIVDDKIINLKNGVSIDLWSVGKWYMVDRIFNMLDKHFEKFVIDFWWDIRTKWNHKIFLEDPVNLWKKIWEIDVNNFSIASSAWNRRKTEKWHHLINPKKDNSEEKLCVFTVHKLSSFSDILSTAIFVSPLKKSIEIINKSKWLEALIIMKNWEIYKTKWFNFKKN